MNDNNLNNEDGAVENEPWMESFMQFIKKAHKPSGKEIEESLNKILDIVSVFFVGLINRGVPPEYAGQMTIRLITILMGK